MSGMVCFGAGVLIATIFLHMQPGFVILTFENGLHHHSLCLKCKNSKIIHSAFLEVRDFMHPRDEYGELICEIGSFSYGDLVIRII